MRGHVAEKKGGHYFFMVCLHIPICVVLALVSDIATAATKMATSLGNILLVPYNNVSSHIVLLIMTGCSWFPV